MHEEIDNPNNPITVGIIVNRFPVRTETFILRLIEGLAKVHSIKVTIIALESFCESLLFDLSPNLHNLYQVGIIKVEARVFVDKSTGYFGRAMYVILDISSLILTQPLLSTRMLLERVGWRRMVEVRRLSMKPGIKSFQNDVLHSQYLTIGFSTAIAARLTGSNLPRLVASARGHDVGGAYGMNRRHFSYLQRHGCDIDSIFSVSADLARTIINDGYENDRVSTVYSGLKLTDYKYRPHDLREGTITFLQVGRLTDKKAYDLSIRMVSSLKALTSCKVVLRVVGEGPLLERLQKLTQELSCTNNVHFIGSVSHSRVINEMERADFLVCPSRISNKGDREGIPNVIKEAMLVGLPVLASDHGGIAEIVEHGRTGYLFPENDLEIFLKVTLEAISGKNRRHDIANEAACRARVMFDNNSIVAYLVKTYEELARCHRVDHAASKVDVKPRNKLKNTH